MRCKRKSIIVVESSNIQVGTLIWAKMRGYASWPALVVAIKGVRINVKFFGDNTTGVVFRNQVTEFKKGFKLNEELMQQRQDVFLAAMAASDYFERNKTSNEEQMSG